MSTCVPELIETHRGGAMAVARRVAHDSQEAPDVVQEACIAALTHEWDPERDFRPWFYRITQREAMQANKRRRRRQQFVQPLADLDTKVGSEMGVYIAATLVGSALAAAFEALSESDRTLIYRLYIDGVSRRSLGAELGIKPNTLEQRVKRAKDRLWEALMRVRAETLEV